MSRDKKETRKSVASVVVVVKGLTRKTRIGNTLAPILLLR